MPFPFHQGNSAPQVSVYLEEVCCTNLDKTTLWLEHPDGCLGCK